MLTKRRITITALALAAALPAPVAAASATTDKRGQQTDATQPARPGDGPKNRQIAGGYYPGAGVWPWTTAIVRHGTNRSSCTAVLVAPDRVLTAAHCVVSSDGLVTPDPAGDYQVVVGSLNLDDPAQGERRNVTGIAVHPKAQLPVSGTHRNHAFYDIAVLFLDQPVAATPATIGVPTTWNSWATAMGWGHHNYDHRNPQTDGYLRAADFSLLDDAQCGALFDDARAQHFYPAIHVCADDAPGGQIDCITHGDSGGPLMVLTTEGWRLIGITSFYSARGSACGTTGRGPFGFAWVAGPEMRDWPLSVPHPPVVTTGTGGTGGGAGNPGPGGTGGGSGGGAPTPPPTPDLTMQPGQAQMYVTRMIRSETDGAIKRLKRSCARLDHRSFRCTLSWRIGRRAFSGRARFVHYAEGTTLYWAYSFTGQRRVPGRATKRLRWS